MEIQISSKPRLSSRRFIGRIYTSRFTSSCTLPPSSLPPSLQILSPTDEKTVPVNESVQFRRSRCDACSKWRYSENFEKVETRFAKSDIPSRSDRLNRDNPSERSEHTSPVSGIITLFRSKPRYRSPCLLFRAIPRRSSPIDCFPLVRSPRSFSPLKLTAASPFFSTSETISPCRIDRSDFPDLLPLPPVPLLLKIFLPALRSYVSLLLLSILLCVVPWL